MLSLRNLGEAALVPAVDHFDGRDVRHHRVPAVLVRKALALAVLLDDALGRRHAATNFAENRERHEGNDEASIHRLRRVGAQYVHVEVRFPGHEALFNAVALPVRVESELRRALHRGNARKEPRTLQLMSNGIVVPDKAARPRSPDGLLEPAQSSGGFEPLSDHVIVAVRPFLLESRQILKELRLLFDRTILTRLRF